LEIASPTRRLSLGARNDMIRVKLFLHSTV
jgi:hypothetical protein